MAKTKPVNSENNLISRRTLLNNGLLTGLSIAAAYYLSNPSKILHTTPDKLDFKKGSNNYLTKQDKKSKEVTYIDNFDC